MPQNHQMKAYITSRIPGEEFNYILLKGILWLKSFQTVVVSTHPFFTINCTLYLSSYDHSPAGELEMQKPSQWFSGVP